MERSCNNCVELNLFFIFENPDRIPSNFPLQTPQIHIFLIFQGRLLCWDLMTRQVESHSFDMFKSPIVPIEQDTATYGCLRDEDKHHRIQHGHGLSCRYSPDGKWIVASGSEQDVYVFNSESMEQVATLHTGCGWNWDAIFSSEGR